MAGKSLAQGVGGGKPPGYSRLAKRIEQETGLRAFTDEAFVNSTLSWWLRNTGVPGSFLTTVVVGMVGPAMSVVRLQRLQPEEAFRN